MQAFAAEDKERVLAKMISHVAASSAIIQVRFWAHKADLNPAAFEQGIANALKDPVSLLDSRLLNPLAYPNS